MNKPEFKPEVITLFEQKQKEIGFSVIEKPGTVEYNREAYRYLIENALIPPTTENVALALTGKNTIVLSLDEIPKGLLEKIETRLKKAFTHNPDPGECGEEENTDTIDAEDLSKQSYINELQASLNPTDTKGFDGVDQIRINRKGRIVEVTVWRKRLAIISEDYVVQVSWKVEA